MILDDMAVDRARIPRSYRDYLRTLKDMGELIEINGEVDWYLELGAIFRRTAETLSPGAIFNKIRGCPAGFRAADFGMGKSGTPGRPWGRLAVMLGLPPAADLMSMQRAYLDAIRSGKPHPPRIIDAGKAPCKQNKWFEEDIDLTKFPAPVGHDGDSGRYLQTAGINILRTPDGRWTNWSTNRAKIIDRNHMTGLWLPKQHNGMIWNMWKTEGKDMPWACALGVSPAVATQAGSRCPDWTDEYDVASALLDDAIDMVRCETNDLLVPADSEIVIEGLVSHSEVEVEGPFGEYPGYLPAHTFTMPLQTVTAVTFRDDPILPVSFPGVPTDNCHISIGFFTSADIVVALREAGIPVIDAMLTFESALHWLVIRVPSDWHASTGLKVDDFVKKIANSFWTQHVQFGTKILVVGEDIDPADPNQVTWAFATRNHPTLSTFHFPDLQSVGSGLEAYHSVNETLRGKGGLVIYSCLELEERVGLPGMRVLSFETDYPKPIQEKVRANWKGWGFERK
jgi:4-hydroxy-3-polyprenylbenzoate decarboxylase